MKVVRTKRIRNINHPTNILLGNTGRGGEQCVFSAILQAYKTGYPDAKITIAVAPEFVKLYKSDTSISIIPLDHEDPSKPHYKDPTSKWYSVVEENQDAFDLIENASEHGIDNHCNTIIRNIYSRLNRPPCPLSQIIKRPTFVPSDEERREAENTLQKYGPDLLIISPVSNSARPVAPMSTYHELAFQLSKYYPVATTGVKDFWSWYLNTHISDPLLNGTIDLRGQSFLVLNQISHQMLRYLGPDTGTSWMVTGMPGRLVTLRGDQVYPIENTGLVNNEFRSSENTLEYDTNDKTQTQIIDNVLAYLIQ